MFVPVSPSGTGYIQIIDSLLCLCDGDGAEEQHLLEHGTIDGIVQ